MSKRFTAVLVLSALCLLALAPAGASAQRARARGGARPAGHAHEEADSYSCPMHPDVISTKPGRCAKCGMNLTAAEKTAAPKGDGPVAAGEVPQIPDVSVTDQHGRRLNFYSDLVKGKTVAVNFIFTTCTGVCPPMTANLAKVQNYLGDRVGRDVRIVSISVDPTVDTPEKLKKYAEGFHAGPGWYFLTGKKENVDWVLYKLGGYVGDKMQHSAILVIGNETTGEWLKTAALKNPSQIAEAVMELLTKP